MTIQEKFNGEIEALANALDVQEQEIQIQHHRADRYHVLVSGNKIGSSKKEENLYVYFKGLIFGANFATKQFPYDK